MPVFIGTHGFFAQQLYCPILRNTVQNLTSLNSLTGSPPTHRSRSLGRMPVKCGGAPGTSNAGRASFGSCRPPDVDGQKRVAGHAETCHTRRMEQFFEWDDNKAKSNLKKHGIRFEEAAGVFDDPLAWAEPNRSTRSEERWTTIGLSGGGVLLYVVHTARIENGCEVIRIISARRVTKEERRRYEHGAIQER